VSKRRLLLADDSLTIQKVVNLTFAEEGIEVVTAGDGNSAMEKFVQSPPDLVMVDVNMPGFDGYKICEMIKQDEETKQIPVILLVGSFEPFDEVEARRVGADDFLTKPFQSIRQLVSRVTDLLNRSNGNVVSYNPVNSGSENHVIEAATVNNFAHSVPLANNSDFQLFDDSAMDDEMIQTDQIGSLPEDETQKFISEQAAETAKNDFSFQNNYKTEEISLETQPLTGNYFQQNPPNSTDDEILGLDEKIFDFSKEPSFAQENKSNVTQNNAPETTKEVMPTASTLTTENKNIMSDTNSNQASQTPNASIFDFDDLDLLDLPPVEKKNVSIESEQTIIEEIPETAAPQNVEVKQEPAKPVEKESSKEMTNLSPEVIEAITKKIMEKLSDKVIREIVQEVTPQTVESVIREMTEKKTN
jgi:DNA-binding response OmpR family regulator